MKKAINSEAWENLLLLRELDGTPSYFNLCKTFLANTPAKLMALRKGIQANNNLLVTSEASELKNSSAMLGAVAFSQLCSAVEGLARAGVVSATGNPILLEIQAEYVTVTTELQALLQEAQRTKFSEAATAKASPIAVPSGLRVLIIDDDLFYRTLLSKLVSQIIDNPEVLAVESYENAVDALRESGKPENKSFDLIIADLNLKTSSTGIDVWRVSQVHAKKAAFLLMSGTPLDEFITLVGEQVGEVPSYLPKPFRLDHARALLEWLLRSRNN
jgi:HPt (histidine-containing phosphotransfer) domain-containing protein/CheY-like chemotaxis protein